MDAPGSAQVKAIVLVEPKVFVSGSVALPRSSETR